MGILGDVSFDEFDPNFLVFTSNLWAIFFELSLYSKSAYSSKFSGRAEPYQLIWLFDGKQHGANGAVVWCISDVSKSLDIVSTICKTKDSTNGETYLERSLCMPFGPSGVEIWQAS